jgi:gas vesicle protein
MRRALGFLIGVLVGGLVGAVTALLLAPSSGQQLRGSLRDRGQSFLDEIRVAADSRRIELRERLENLRAPRLPQG